MENMDETFEFSATIVEWRGPSPFHFAAVPPVVALQLRAEAATVSYGWGMVPVTVSLARAGRGAGKRRATYDSSLFPRDGGYMVPLKDRARHHLDAMPGDRVRVTLAIRAGKASDKVALQG